VILFGYIIRVSPDIYLFPPYVVFARMNVVLYVLPFITQNFNTMKAHLCILLYDIEVLAVG